MKKNKLLFVTLVLLIVSCLFIRPIKVIYEHKTSFFSPGYKKQYNELARIYYSSQYVKKNNPGIIPDETFEAFAGGAFLNGLNPILIVHDHPPLGRYMVALSIFLFDNASFIILPLLLFSVLGVYLISKIILHSYIVALIPMGIFINEPLFLNKLIYTPLPEPIQLPFIIFSIYFFIKGIKSRKYIWWFLLTSLMIGCVISTRFFITGAVLTCAMILFLLLKKELHKRVIPFISLLPLSLAVLFLSYTRTFQSGYSLIKIIGIQKYIFFYHKSKFILPFSFWDLILFNRWHTWWGNNTIIRDEQWIAWWPITTMLTFCYFILSKIKKIAIEDEEKLLFLWIILYSLMLSVGYTSTRYFLPLLPFIYILSISFLYKFLTGGLYDRKNT